MFEKIRETEKQIEEMKVFLQCGIYRVREGNKIIIVENKLESLKRDLQAETEKARKKYFEI